MYCSRPGRLSGAAHRAGGMSRGQKSKPCNLVPPESGGMLQIHPTSSSRRCILSLPPLLGSELLKRRAAYWVAVVSCNCVEACTALVLPSSNFPAGPRAGNRRAADWRGYRYCSACCIAGQVLRCGVVRAKANGPSVTCECPSVHPAPLATAGTHGHTLYYRTAMLCNYFCRRRRPCGGTAHAAAKRCQPGGR